jgi:NAD(P)-dependent dehydrogenase (short-subunit alcohol dehydrogenase family)
MNPLDLTGRSILLTGASSGIGRTTAILLSRLGASVVLAARREEQLRATLALMEGSGHLVSPVDLNGLENIPAWFAGLVRSQGPFHGFVHSAGVAELLPLRVLTVGQMEQTMRVNFYAAAALTKEFCRKGQHQPGSSIVLVASVAGLLGAAARTAYSASKGALIAFARSAALELAKIPIRVNCVAPAYVKTEMYDTASAGMAPEQLAALVATMQPLGLGDPMDVAHAVAFLLADTGRWITGSVLTVDGGYSAQ